MAGIARLYARTSGNSSHAVVSRGFEQVLQDTGLLAGVVSMDAPGDLEAVEPPGALVPVGIYTAQLGAAERMCKNARHAERLVMVAPNSNLIPPNLLGYLAHVCTEWLVPSEWAAGVCRKLLAVSERRDESRPSLPAVTVVPHGIDRAFTVNEHARAAVRDSYMRGEFRVLHLSTSDRQRKGTLELVQAWIGLRASGRLPPKARLALLLDVAAAVSLQEKLLDAGIMGMPPGTQIVTRMDAEPEKMAELLSSAHLVVQPSRGEGFGITPIESLACGVPIAATNVTGHSQWFTKGLPGAELVHTGADAPLDDWPGAVAPELLAESVEDAVGLAYSDWRRLATAAEQNAATIQAEWSWARQLAPFVSRLRARQEEPA